VCVCVCVCVYVCEISNNIFLTGIVKAVDTHYKTITDSRYWLSRDTAHIYSTAEDLGWGCGYRNTQMMISCLLDDPIYIDNVISGKYNDTNFVNYVFAYSLCVRLLPLRDERIMGVLLRIVVCFLEQYVLKL